MNQDYYFPLFGLFATAGKIFLLSEGGGEQSDKADPEKYAGWLTETLLTEMPSAKPHLAGAQWAVEGNTVTLTVGSKIASDLMLMRGVDRKLSQVIGNVFRREPSVQIISGEQRSRWKNIWRTASAWTRK